MKRWTLAGIVFCVVAAHGIFFWWASDKKPLPKREHIPSPNFHVVETAVVDPGTGEKTVYQEFTVSTKLNNHSH